MFTPPTVTLRNEQANRLSFRFEMTHCLDAATILDRYALAWANRLGLSRNYIQCTLR